MLVFAHRGAPRKGEAENTLGVFATALSRGVDGVEFDVRLSRDGQIVVFHDPDLRRLAGDVRHVADLTAAELQDVQLRGHGIVPTLCDVTGAIGAPTQLDIEIKDEQAVEPVISKLQTSAGLRARTIVSSFRLDSLVHVREKVPDVRTLFLFPSWPLPLRRQPFWKRIEAAGVWGVGTRGVFLNARRITGLRKRGWVVAAWDDRPLPRLTRQIARLKPDIAIVYGVEEAITVRDGV